MAAILRGFYIGSVGVGGMMSHGPDPELLRPYVKRYLDALPAVWAERTIDEAEMFTECLYPSHLVDDSVVMAVDLALEGGELPGPAVRILREGRDGTLRAQRARELDAAAGVAQPAE
jgi:aminopeptidase N